MVDLQLFSNYCVLRLSLLHSVLLAAHCVTSYADCTIMCHDARAVSLAMGMLLALAISYAAFPSAL